MADSENEKAINVQLGLDFEILGLPFSGVVDEERGLWRLAAYTQNVSLKEVLKRYCDENGCAPIDFPEELGGIDLEIEKLLFYIDSLGTVRFAGEAALQNHALSGDLGQLGMADQLDLQFSFTFENKAISKASFKLHGRTGKELLSGVHCNALDLVFEYAAGEGQASGRWLLGGHINARLFDLPAIDLSVAYTLDGTHQQFQLTSNMSRDRGAVTPEEMDPIAPGLFQQLVQKGYLDQTVHGDASYYLTDRFCAYDVNFRLSLDPKFQQHEKAARKALQKTRPLIDASVVSLDIKGIALALKKGPDGSVWDFSAVGDFNINDFSHHDQSLICIENGRLTLAVDTGADTATFVFSADEAVMHSPRVKYIQVDGSRLEKKKFGFDISFDSITIGKDENWYFESRVGFQIVDMPSPLDRLVPKEKLNCDFSIKKEQDGWQMHAGVTGGLPKVQIPDIARMIHAHASDDSASLLPEIGHGIIELTRIGINVSNGLSLELTLAIGLPSGLNELIGLKPHQVIRTYNDQEGDEKRAESLIQATLAIGTEGISGRIEDSPFQDLRGITTEGEWIKLDFDKIFGEKDMGLIRLQKPELALNLDNGSFKAAGGYQIDPERKIKIPLSPLRKFLEMVHLGALGALLPRGIPIESVSLFDDDGHLRTDDLKKAFGGMRLHPPDFFWDIIDEIAKVADNLPDRFKEYMSIKVPDQLTFAIDVTADGSISFDLAVKGDPLQLLLPLLPQPMLLGIRLYRIAFGTAFANSVLKLEIDGEMDTFDLPTLAGAVIFPMIKEPHIANLLPESAKLQSSFIARELVILIVYETGIPIPIPLFYKKLEIAYFGITDIEMRDLISFPKPQFNAMELLRRFGDLSAFFTSSHKKKSEEDPAQETGLLPIEHYGEPLGEALEEGSQMDIVFAFGPLYLRLPKFLGYQETEYYELTNDSYHRLVDEEIIAGQNSLSEMRRQRFLTRAGFERAVKNCFEGEENAGIDHIVELCRFHRPMGQLIGTVKNRRISGWDLLYLIMNSVKLGSINYAIQYFHIDDRIGNMELSLFGIFDLYATWALTTPGEFDAVAYPKLVAEYTALAKRERLPVLASQSPSDELIRLIADNDTGEAVTDETEGVAIFMRGGLCITRQVIFETAFGLMAEGVRGFKTGVSFLGHVGNIVDARLLGFIKISPKSDGEKFKLLGKSALKIFEREVVSGLFVLTNERLLIDGRLDLFPRDFPLVLKGHVVADISKTRFLLDAGVQFALGQLRALARIYLHAEDNVPAEIIRSVPEELQVREKEDINVLFIKLLFGNAAFSLAIVGQSDRASEASVDASFHCHAANLIRFEGELNITVNRSCGFALLGRSTLVIGPERAPLIRGEAALAAALDPQKGYFGIRSETRLSLCFFSAKAALSGGFAFFTWFSGDHAGDFLLSIGGYHPLFKRPSHYPAVPRLALNFQLGKHLAIKGSGYFTLTPACIMGGGRLEAAWRLGGFRASFAADADFLIAWKPFHYHMRLFVNMRLSYTYTFFGTHTLSGEMGADLTLWGPELSGRATVHIWRLTFPIKFGSGKQPTPAPIGWTQFRRDFLTDGGGDALCRIVPVDGVTRDLSKAEPPVDGWVIHPERFGLSVLTAIPVKRSVFGRAKAVNYPAKVGVAPMALGSKDFKSEHTIKITRDDNQAAEHYFRISPIHANSPKALWGETLTPNLKDDALVGGTVTGFDIRPVKMPEVGATADVAIEELQGPGRIVEKCFDWQADRPAGQADMADDDREAFEKCVAATRAVRFEILTAFGLDENKIPEGLPEADVAAMMVVPRIWAGAQDPVS